jgi:hypothetical protein
MLPDPTRSQTKRTRLQRRLHQKWRTVRGAVRRKLTGDSYYRPQNDIAIGEQASAFREWLDAELDAQVVEPVITRRQIIRGSHWTGQLVREFYEHGIHLAHADLREAGIPAEHPALSVAPDAVLRADRPRFGGDGVHADLLGENYDEFYTDLVDAARAASKAAYREYRDAVRTGATVTETIDRVNDRLDAIGETRTDLVARVKTIQTINDAIRARYAQLATDPELVRVGAEIETSSAIDPDDRSSGTQTQSQSVVTDGGVQAPDHTHARSLAAYGPLSARVQHATDSPGSHIREVFETAGDDRVCDECAALEGAVYTLGEIESGVAPQIPIHVNCRCRWRLFDTGDLGWV